MIDSDWFQEYLKEPGIKNYILRTLYNWFTDPKPKKTASDKEFFFWGTKWYIAKWFFMKAGPKYHELITWITQYYPFSLLYKETLIHADNIKVRELMHNLENIAEKEELHVFINTGEWGRYFSTLHGSFERKPKNLENAMSKLEEIFLRKYPAFYFRKLKDKFDVLVPEELL